MRKAKPSAPSERQHRDNVKGANEVTKDFLLFSQPYIHEGALLSSSTSGRRLYIHHLSEVPLSEVFTTREGNHLQRNDKTKATLAGIELEVGPRPAGAVAANTPNNTEEEDGATTCEREEDSGTCDYFVHRT